MFDDFDTHEIEMVLATTSHQLAPQITLDDAEDLFGPALGKKASASNCATLVEFLLRADVLRVCLICLYADGVLSPRERSVICDLIAPFARHLAAVRPKIYGEYSEFNHDNANAFFKAHFKDAGPLGFACEETKWRGVRLCRAVKAATGIDAATVFVGCLRQLSERLMTIDGLSHEDRSVCAALLQELFGQDEPVDSVHSNQTPADDSVDRHSHSIIYDEQEDAATALLNAKSSPTVGEQEGTGSRLSTCPDCDGKVSRRATECPHCGCPLRGKLVQCRITVHKQWQEAGSARRTALHIDGKFKRDFLAGEGTTFVVEPGIRVLRFSCYGLLSGARSEIMTINLPVEEGQHLNLTFGGSTVPWGPRLLYDVTERLD